MLWILPAAAFPLQHLDTLLERYITGNRHQHVVLSRDVNTSHHRPVKLHNPSTETHRNVGCNWKSSSAAKNRPLTSELLANTGNDFKRAGPHGKGWIISALFITFLGSRGGELEQGDAIIRKSRFEIAWSCVIGREENRGTWEVAGLQTLSKPRKNCLALIFDAALLLQEDNLNWSQRIEHCFISSSRDHKIKQNCCVWFVIRIRRVYSLGGAVTACILFKEGNFITKRICQGWL